MDATFTAVARLWDQELSQKDISRRLNISEQKVRKILITIGAVETEESRLLKQAFTVDQIAEMTGKTKGAVSGRIPYDKGIYNAEYPSINALRIRRCRENKG